MLAFLLKATLTRPITAQRTNALRHALYFIIASGLGVLAVLVALLQRTVVRPLQQLTEHILEVGRTGEWTSRINLRRSDEIGTLAKAYDRMLAQPDHTRNKLLEQSYQAGMAEVSSGVLHNVHNALNPMFGRMKRLRLHLAKVPVDAARTAAADPAPGHGSSGEVLHQPHW